MQLRTALRKSALIAPVEDALQRCSNQSELEDVWFDLCDNFADESPERKRLLSIYMDKAAQFKAEHRARVLENMAQVSRA